MPQWELPNFSYFWSFQGFFVPCGSSRLGVEVELQLPAYTTATATPDPSRICDLHHSSQQCRIPDPPREARDRACSLRIQVRFISAVPQQNSPKHFFLTLYFEIIPDFQKVRETGRRVGTLPQRTASERHLACGSSGLPGPWPRQAPLRRTRLPVTVCPSGPAGLRVLTTLR